LVTASYGGDSSHQPSTGQSAQITATAPPPSAGRGSIKQLKASGASASATLSCAGGSSCTLELTLLATETLRGGKVVAIDSSARTKTRTKVVVLGKATFTLTAGQSKAVKVALNATGQRLLKKDHTLKAKLTITESGKTVATSLLTFGAKRPH
jgi:hypothetical protein